MSDHNLDSLSDEELRRLREVFLRLCDAVPTPAIRAVIACLNEVDARLIKRGRGPSAGVPR